LGVVNDLDLYRKYIHFNVCERCVDLIWLGWKWVLNCVFVMIVCQIFFAVRVSGYVVCDISGMNISTENIGYFLAVVEWAVSARLRLLRFFAQLFCRKLIRKTVEN
jgi:hypothetical protein